MTESESTIPAAELEKSLSLTIMREIDDGQNPFEKLDQPDPSDIFKCGLQLFEHALRGSDDPEEAVIRMLRISGLAMTAVIEIGHESDGVERVFDFFNFHYDELLYPVIDKVGSGEAHEDAPFVNPDDESVREGWKQQVVTIIEKDKQNIKKKSKKKQEKINEGKTRSTKKKHR